MHTSISIMRFGEADEGLFKKGQSKLCDGEVIRTDDGILKTAEAGQDRGRIFCEGNG